MLLPAVIPVTAREYHVLAFLLGARFALRRNGKRMSELVLIEGTLRGFVRVRIFFIGIFLDRLVIR